MMFKQWQQILDGTKTQTRRLVKANEYALHNGPGYAELPIMAVLTKRNHAYRWVIGHTYAVQRPDGKTVGRTPPVRAIRQERLGAISEKDCRAEGIEYSLLFPDGHRYEQYGCPICDLFYREYGAAYVCLWNHCGNWERDKDSIAWVLDWGER